MFVYIFLSINIVHHITTECTMTTLPFFCLFVFTMIQFFLPPFLSLSCHFLSSAYYSRSYLSVILTASSRAIKCLLILANILLFVHICLWSLPFSLLQDAPGELLYWEVLSSLSLFCVRSHFWDLMPFFLVHSVFDEAYFQISSGEWVHGN